MTGQDLEGETPLTVFIYFIAIIALVLIDMAMEQISARWRRFFERKMHDAFL